MTDVEERLAGWIRGISLEPGATRQEAIGKAATTLSKTVRGRAILDLILLAHREPSSGASATVAEAIHQQDETWAVRPGDLETALTAAVGAAIAMDGAPESSVPFALAIGMAAHMNLTPVVTELPALARASLVSSSERLRERAGLTYVAPGIKAAFANVAEFGGEEPASLDDLGAVVKAATSAASRATSPTERLVPILQRRLAAAEEEINLLWWIIGGYSEIANRPFDAVPNHALACVTGIELVSLLQLHCPLPSNRAILSRILQDRAQETSTIADAVPATLDEVGEEWLPETDGHALLSVISAAREFVNLKRAPVWKEAVASRWGVDAMASVANQDLADRICTELLFLAWV